MHLTALKHNPFTQSINFLKQGFSPYSVLATCDNYFIMDIDCNSFIRFLKLELPGEKWNSSDVQIHFKNKELFHNIPMCENWVIYHSGQCVIINSSYKCQEGGEKALPWTRTKKQRWR